MLKHILSSIKIWVISLFSRVQTKPQAVDNPVSTTAKQDVDPAPIQKEIAYFTRANSLRDEFADKEAMVAYKGKMYKESELKQFTELQDEFDKLAPATYNPWADTERFPLKTRELTAEELGYERANATEETKEYDGELVTKIQNNNEYEQ